MKTSKMLGAVALTAALAMGTVPALAAQPEDPSIVPPQEVGRDQVVNATYDKDKKTASGHGDTAIYGQSYIPQLNVTIPIEMGVALPAVDGDIVFPTTYTIKNNGTDDVTVTKVKGKGSSDFALATEMQPTAAMVTGTAKGAVSIAVQSGMSDQKLVKTTDEEINWTVPGSNNIAVSFAGKTAWKTDKTAPVEFNNRIIEVATLTYTVAAAAPESE